MSAGVMVCQICGTQNQGHGGLERRCITCGCEVAPATDLGEFTSNTFEDIVGSRSTKKNTPEIVKPANTKGRAVEIAKAVSRYGGIGALVGAAGAIPLGIAIISLLSESGTAIGTLQIVKVAGSFGATLGFLFSSVWGACHRADVNHVGGIALGIALGIPLCVTNMMLMVPRHLMPEVGIFEFVCVGLVAGAVTGAFLGIRVEE